MHPLIRITACTQYSRGPSHDEITHHLITVIRSSGSGKMEKAATGVLMLFMLLPVVLGANPYRRFLKDVVPIEAGASAVHEVNKDVAVEKSMLLMEQAKPGDVGDVKCPDGSSCSVGNTCCLHISGGYGCCPDANGNCCDDYMSCCNSGQVCDDANGKCTIPTLDILDKIRFLLKSSSTRHRL